MDATRLQRLLTTNEIPLSLETAHVNAIIIADDERLNSIDKQIAQLQRERESVQTHRARHLSIVSAARRIPMDVLQEIFLHIHAVDRQSPWHSLDVKHEPWTISHVSRLWRLSVLSLSCLWSNIGVNENFLPESLGGGPQQLLELQISRSLAAPPSLFIHQTYKGTASARFRQMLDTMATLIPRAERLDIYLERQLAEGILPQTSFPHLRVFHLSSPKDLGIDGKLLDTLLQNMPVLREIYMNSSLLQKSTVGLDNITLLDGPNPAFCSSGQVHEHVNVLSRMQNVEELYLSVSEGPRSLDPALDDGPVELNELRKLSLNFFIAPWGRTSSLLDHLFMPHLEDLHLLEPDLQFDELEEHICLENLETLTMDVTTQVDPKDFLEECPKLHTLCINCAEEGIHRYYMNRLEELFATRDSTFLPELRAVTVSAQHHSNPFSLDQIEKAPPNVVFRLT